MAQDTGIAVGPDERRAIDILGQDKVFLAAQVAGQWNTGLAQHPLILFSKKVLYKCARDNQAGNADWYLVYVLGLSLRKQRELRGTDRNKQPCFYNDSWWMNHREDKWAIQGIPSGYRLLNFKLQFLRRSWQEQEKDIAELGNKYERAEEQAVAEAFLSIFMVRDERLMQGVYHWGRLLDSDGRCVFVGPFEDYGLAVGSRLLNNCHGPAGSVGVVVSLKPDLIGP